MSTHIDCNEMDNQLDGICYVALTINSLNIGDIVDRVRSPKAGAIVLFAGKCAFLYLDLFNKYRHN